MATASVKPKKKQEPVGKMIQCTFLKWYVEEVFDYKTEIIDGMTYMVKIYCKMCVKHINSVERDDKMKGVARAGMRTYVDGSAFITKHNVNRHINGLRYNIISNVMTYYNVVHE